MEHLGSQHKVLPPNYKQGFYLLRLGKQHTLLRTDLTLFGAQLVLNGSKVVTRTVCSDCLHSVETGPVWLAFVWARGWFLQNNSR